MAYADIDGLQLAVSDTGGDGPPVLFCHGSSVGSAPAAYDRQVDELRDVYRVLTSRLRVDVEQPVELATDAWSLPRALFGVMDSLGIERAVLCGADDAGEVVARAALLHPDRVRGLVLLHAPLPVGRDELDPDHLGDRLEELAMPVLLVHGDADPERPLGDARRIVEVVSDPRGLVKVTGGTARLTTTHAAEVTAAIRDYLEGLPA